MNKTQFLKLLLFMIATSLGYYVALELNDELFISILSAISTSPPYIIAFNTAITLYLLKYTDAVSTSVSSAITETNSPKINKFQKSIKNLNQEAILNMLLTIIIFVLLKIVESAYFELDKDFVFQFVMAVRFSLIALLFIVAIIQGRALFLAMNYRHVIETKNKC